MSDLGLSVQAVVAIATLTVLVATPFVNYYLNNLRDRRTERLAARGKLRVTLRDSSASTPPADQLWEKNVVAALPGHAEAVEQAAVDLAPLIGRFGKELLAEAKSLSKLCRETIPEALDRANLRYGTNTPNATKVKEAFHARIDSMMKFTIEP